jgi:membrane protein YdbS with pleckstrin-like domain
MATENTVWTGGPSQVENTGVFIICAVLAVFTFGISLLYAGWRYQVTKNHRYELTTQRLMTHSGVLSKINDELELFRVKDTRYVQPFFLRLFGLGNVILVSNDISSPLVVISAITGARELREQIRTLVDERRDVKRVSTVERE